MVKSADRGRKRGTAVSAVRQDRDACPTPMQAQAGDITVIIPAYNEADGIRHVIESCLSLLPVPEILVVDGGSQDGTLEKASDMGVQTLQSVYRGRSFQMNAGAARASGSTFVFLHADTRLDQDAWDALLSVLKDPAIHYGAFKRRYHAGAFLPNLYCYLGNWRGRLRRIFLGDQTIFVRREAFESVHGYKTILLFEDLDLCVRLRKSYRGCLVKAVVRTSQRRFDAEGSISRYAKNIGLWLRYLWGADPDELARRYYPDYYNTNGRSFPE